MAVASLSPDIPTAIKDATDLWFLESRMPYPDFAHPFFRAADGGPDIAKIQAAFANMERTGHLATGLAYQYDPALARAIVAGNAGEVQRLLDARSAEYVSELSESAEEVHSSSSTMSLPGPSLRERTAALAPRDNSALLIGTVGGGRPDAITRADSQASLALPSSSSSSSSSIEVASLGSRDERMMFVEFSDSMSEEVPHAVDDAAFIQLNRTLHGALAPMHMRGKLVGRVAGLILASVARVSDVVLGPLLLAYSFYQLKADHSAVSIASAALNVAATVPFMAAGILALVGAEMAMVVALPLLVVAVALTAIAILITIFVRRSAGADEPALRTWLDPFVQAGLVRGGASGVAALVAWHTSHPDSAASWQSLPFGCRPDGGSCRRSPQPGPTTTRFVLRQQGSGFCASLSDYPARVGTTNASMLVDTASARLAACDSTVSDSVFYVLPDVGGGTERLVSRAHTCLDNYGGSSRNGVGLVAYGCAFGDAASAWSVSSPRADGSVAVSNAGSRLCLDSDHGQIGVGTGLVQGTCSNSATQRWVLTAAPSPSFLLRQTGSGLCAVVGSASTSQPVGLGSCVPGVDRVYTTDRFDGGQATVGLADGVCLDVPHDSGTAGVAVQGYDCDGGDRAQWWTFAPTGRGDGSVSLTRPHGQCLDTANAATAAGSGLVQGACTQSATQTWVLVPVPDQNPVLLSQVGSGWCAAISAGTASGKGTVAECAGYLDRSFYLAPVADGSLRLQLADGVCLAETGTASGSSVAGVACAAGGAGSSWQLAATGDAATGSIVNAASHRCLDTADAGTAVHSLLVVGDCRAGSTTQQWRVHSPAAPAQTLTQTGSGRCATLTLAGGAAFVLGNCTSATGLYPIPARDGIGTVLTLPGGACLRITTTATGSPVSPGQCADGDPASEWDQIPSGAGDGTVMLRNESSHECLDTDYARTEAGTRLVQGSCITGSATQQWALN